MRYLALSLGLHVILALGLVVSGLRGNDSRQLSTETVEVEWIEVSPAMASSVKPSAPRPYKKRIQQPTEPNEKIASSSESLAESSPSLESVDAASAAQQARTYAEELKSYIESNRVYPRQALKLQQTGTVTVKLQIGPSGEFRNIDILEPSPFETLNQAAVHMLKNLKGFKPPPDNLKTAENFVVPIVYQIREKRSL